MGNIACNTKFWAASAKEADSYDSWVDKLNETYGNWNVSSNEKPDFSAQIQINQFGKFQIIDCKVDPCGGDRSSVNMAQDQDEILAIQLVVSGREKMQLGDKEFSLKPGDIFVWDNTQKMQFEVRERLHKISAIMPLQRLKDWMPSAWKDMPRQLFAGTPHNNILKSYMLSLSNTELDGSMMNDNALTETTIAMLANSMSSLSDIEDGSVKFGQLQCIKDYIDRRLHDPELAPKSIAHANAISVRYLHWLFSETGNTVTQYIISQRLDRCKYDIANSMMSYKTITQIAYSWGFSDSAHFSKRFKMAYGSSPRDYRARSRLVVLQN